MSLYEKVLAAQQADADVDEALVAAGPAAERLIEAYRSILTSPDIDGSTAAITLALPGQSELVQNIHEADPTVVHKVRSFVRRTIGQQLMPELTKVCSTKLPPHIATSQPFTPCSLCDKA